MNGFTVKKLAEVQAFVGLADPILTRSGKYTEEQAPATSAALRKVQQNGDIARYVAKGELTELFKTKQHQTTAKLIQMMELYINDKWSDPVEVLEWLSFYAGAASAHAALAAAALKELGIHDGCTTANRLSESFTELLVVVKKDLAASAVRSATL
jgi:hypothetical protein